MSAQVETAAAPVAGLDQAPVADRDPVSPAGDGQPDDRIRATISERNGAWHWTVRWKIPGFTGRIGGHAPTLDRADLCVARERRIATRLLVAFERVPYDEAQS